MTPSSSTLRALPAAALALVCLLPAAPSQAAGCVVSHGASGGLHHNFLDPPAGQYSPVERQDAVPATTTTASPGGSSDASPDTSPAVAPTTPSQAPQFIASLAYRYFTSDRHFSGRDEHHFRQQEGSEVINRSAFYDLSLTWLIDDRNSLRFTVPFADHDRSSPLRDDNRQVVDRYHTQASGLSDLRLVANHWLRDHQSDRGNLLLGLGLEMPTGDKAVKDTFVRRVVLEDVGAPGNDVVINEAYKREVDQSIQLGTGGWGLILDLYGYMPLTPDILGYASGSYVIKPEETNGVSTYRSNPYEAEMSITDNYQLRTGVEFQLLPRQHLRGNLGLLLAGVPVEDLVGGSDGFRRPGYDLSVEPGLLLDVGSWSFSLSVPVAIERNRQRSLADKRLSADRGTRVHGDAAFADYQILAAVSRRF